MSGPPGPALAPLTQLRPMTLTWEGAQGRWGRPCGEVHRLIPKRYLHPAFLSFPLQQSWRSRLKRGASGTPAAPPQSLRLPSAFAPASPGRDLVRRPVAAHALFTPGASPAVWAAGERSRGCSGLPAPSLRPVERPRPQEVSGGWGWGQTEVAAPPAPSAAPPLAFLALSSRAAGWASHLQAKPLSSGRCGAWGAEHSRRPRFAGPGAGRHPRGEACGSHSRLLGFRASPSRDSAAARGRESAPGPRLPEGWRGWRRQRRLRAAFSEYGEERAGWGAQRGPGPPRDSTSTAIQPEELRRLFTSIFVPVFPS